MFALCKSYERFRFRSDRFKSPLRIQFTLFPSRHSILAFFLFDCSLCVHNDSHKSVLNQSNNALRCRCTWHYLVAITFKPDRLVRLKEMCAQRWKVPKATTKVKLKQNTNKQSNYMKRANRTIAQWSKNLEQRIVCIQHLLHFLCAFAVGVYNQVPVDNEIVIYASWEISQQ